MTPEFVHRNFKIKRVIGKWEWRFDPRKRTGQRWYYRLSLDMASRTFSGSVYNWNKRVHPRLQKQPLPEDFVGVLRASLPPALLAAAMAAAIEMSP